jgi:hypothetical protein
MSDSQKYLRQIVKLSAIGKLSPEEILRALKEGATVDTKEFADLFEWKAKLINWVGALPKHGKTWLFLFIAQSLLTGENLFGDERFSIQIASKRVVYLIPEVSARSLRKRLHLLGLMEHVFDKDTNPGGRLHIRTLSKGGTLSLRDVTLLSGVEDADVFLDTAIRWIQGDENSAADMKILSESIFGLITAKARSIWCAHHAPKGFESQTFMTLQNMFRGSGESGAGLTNAFGMKKISDVPTTFHVVDIEGRDREDSIPNFHLVLEPFTHGEVRRLRARVSDDDADNLSKYESKKENSRKSGKQPDPRKIEKIAFLRTLSGTNAERARLLAKTFPLNEGETATTPQTVGKWLKESIERSKLDLAADF